MRPRRHTEPWLRLGFATAFGLLPFLLSACSPHSAVIARVGSRTITVEDFEGAARGADERYAVTGDSAKAMLLGDLVRRAMMLERAQRSGLILDSLVRMYRRNVESQILSNALISRLAPRSVPVSEAEVRLFYQWRDTVAHIQVIYVVERRMADGAIAALRQGEDFAQVANRFSLPGLLPPGGDLGLLRPGSLVNPLDLYLRTAPLGQIMGPIQAPGEGWFVLRVLERRRERQEPFELQQGMLRGMLQQRKQRTLALRGFQELRDLYRLQVEPGAAQFLFARYNTPEQFRGMGGEPVPPPPTPEDLRRVLARYDGGRGHRGAYTFADALDDLEHGQGERPNPSMLPAFEQWIESQTIQRIVLLEARRRHLDEEPEVARRIRERVDNYVLESIYDADVVNRSQPTPQELHAAYEMRVPLLARLDAVKLQHLTVPDSSAAERVIEHARSAATIRDAILLASPGLKVREEAVRYPTRDSTWSKLRTALARTPAGEYLTPLRVAHGWRVVQVISKQQFVPRFEDLATDQQQMIRNQAIEFARDRRLAQYTDSLRQALPVQVDRERLKWIPWPVPAAEGPVGERAPGALRFAG